MHIPIKPLKQYPLWLRPFFYNQRRKYGAVLDPGLLWGRVPKLFTAVALLYGVIDRKKSPVDPVLRSLVTVRVSQINWCHFCVDINSATLADRAGSMDKVEQLEQWRDRLVKQPDTMKDFIDQYPQVDRQQLRQVVVKAAASKPNNGEPANDAHKRALKLLFKFIRDSASD